MSLLAEAFERTKHVPVKPWPHAAGDDMRDCLDRAAAATTGMDLATIRDWENPDELRPGGAPPRPAR